MDKPVIKRMSVSSFLACAIHDHFVLHQGSHPKRFELHPEVVRDLKMELDYLALYPGGEIGTMRFMGVEVVETVQASKPKLIDCRNQVVYL